MENVARLLVDRLSRYDVTPILDPAKSIEDRLKEANALKVDYYLVLHTNAYNKSEGRGCETYYQTGVDNSDMVNRLSKEFATKVNDEISAITSSNPSAGDRGIKPWRQADGRDYLWEARENNAPTAYTEIEYHDTQIGCTWIISHPNEIADALCRAVVNQMGLLLKDRKNISYLAHIQNIGNQNRVSNGAIAGTLAKGLAIEALTFSIDEGALSYRSHVQDFGWQSFVSENMVTGTMGLGKRIEALEMNLTLEGYQLKARGHIQDIGWQKWVTGKVIVVGTTGLFKRLEAVQIELVKI